MDLLKRAKENGYFIRCIYVLTCDPSINILRIKSRVADGGHDVPPEKVISRYGKALKLVPHLQKKERQNILLGIRILG